MSQDVLYLKDTGNTAQEIAEYVKLQDLKNRT